MAKPTAQEPRSRTVRLPTTLLDRVQQVRENRAKAARCDVDERAVLESLIEVGLAAEERRDARTSR